jgi:uncharacterized protein
MTPDLISSYLQTHVPGIELAYLFGSEARGDSTAASDVDVAILTKQTLTLDKQLEVTSGLSDLLKREIDLVQLRDATEVFRAQVIRDGKLIYASDFNTKAEFEMRSIVDYIHLNEHRQAILEDFYGQKVF